MARQQAADLEERRTSQARAAAAQAAREARGPPRPLLNPEGSLLHLTRGRPELEALLLQAGGHAPWSSLHRSPVISHHHYLGCFITVLAVLLHGATSLQPRWMSACS